MLSPLAARRSLGARLGGGVALPLTLAQTITAALTAESFACPFLALAQSTDDITQIDGKVSAQINHGSVGGSFTQGTIGARPTWDASDRAIVYAGDDALTSDSTYDASSHAVAFLFGRMKDTDTSGFRFPAEYGNTSSSAGSIAWVTGLPAGSVAVYAIGSGTSYRHVAETLAAYKTIQGWIASDTNPDTAGLYVEGASVGTDVMGNITSAWGTHALTLGARVGGGTFPINGSIQAMGLAFGPAAPSAGLLAAIHSALDGEWA